MRPHRDRRDPSGLNTVGTPSMTTGGGILGRSAGKRVACVDDGLVTVTVRAGGHDMSVNSSGASGSGVDGGPGAQLRRLLAPRVRTHLGETMARVVSFAVGAGILYAVLVGGFALWSSIPIASTAPKIHLQLVIDHNDGTDLLAVFATVVIALNLAAWWPRTVNPHPQPTPADLAADEHDARAALYARHLVLSQAALVCGWSAIVVGQASFVDAAVMKGKLFTGSAISIVAMVIAVFSLDSGAGLRDGKDLEADIRRDRNAAEIKRLRRLVGCSPDGSPGSDDLLARWSEGRTAPLYPAGLTWLSTPAIIAANPPYESDQLWRNGSQVPELLVPSRSGLRNTASAANASSSACKRAASFAARASFR